MRRFEREVKDPVLIQEMLKQMTIVTVSMNDEDGFPYSVPLTFGFEMNDSQLIVYIHSAFVGKKIDLLSKDPRVCLSFSIYNDFPDRPYKGHRHDYRSVTAKGTVKLVKYEDDPELYERGYNALYTCNNREIPPLKERKVIPKMYVGAVTCDMKDVTAKSEFPLRTVEDVPFMNVYEVEKDDKPFDLSDIIAKRKAEMNQ